MKSRYLLSIGLIATILTFSFGMSQSISYNMPFKTNFQNLSPQAKQQVECLAENIYFESGYEPTDGQIAVAMVTINRLESGFAPTICQVVKQKVAHTCQFSWVCEYKNIKSINQDVYLRVRALAVYVYANQKFIKDPSLGALYYHADYVKPGWKNMEIGRAHV